MHVWLLMVNECLVLEEVHGIGIVELLAPGDSIVRHNLCSQGGSGDSGKVSGHRWPVIAAEWKAPRTEVAVHMAPGLKTINVAGGQREAMHGEPYCDVDVGDVDSEVGVVCGGGHGGRGVVTTHDNPLIPFSD